MVLAGAHNVFDGSRTRVSPPGAARAPTMTKRHIIDNVGQASGLMPAIERRVDAAERMSAALWVKTTGDAHEMRAEANSAYHIISVINRPFRAEMFLDGRLSWKRETNLGSINIVSAGREPLAVNTGPYEVLHLYMPAALVANVVAEGTGGQCPSVELVDPECLAADAALAAVGWEVEREMRGAGPLCSLRLDVLAQDVAIHLARRYSNVVWPTEPRPLADAGDWRLRRVTDAIMADLARDWRLDELAALVDLTPRHLTSLFKRRFGVPPHAWLVERRLDQACRLLTLSLREVTDIAYACGFSSPQHFATLFKRRTGATPTSYRGQWTR